MGEDTNHNRPWALRLSGAFWLAMLLVALAGLLVVGKLPAWMIALVMAAGVALGALCFLPRWLARRRDPAYRPGRSFAAFSLAGVLGTIGLASLPLYYLAYWVQTGPVAVPLVTLSNGKKTVVFQGMQHVASEAFYKSVVFDLEKALADGYTLFYEGLQHVKDRPDLTEWFNKTLRGSDTDLSAGYIKMADECGLKFQIRYFQPLVADMAVHPERHVIADVSYLALKNEYDRLLRDDPGFAAAISARQAAQAAKGPSQDGLTPLLESLKDATPGQKNLIGIACRGVLGMVVSGRFDDKNDPSNRVILDFRNRSLARQVAESAADKIYITYGAGHFPGFFAELQKLDPSFAIRSIKGIRPMTLPDEVNLAPSAVTGK